jgi:hypothetical protein
MEDSLTYPFTRDERYQPDARVPLPRLVHLGLTSILIDNAIVSASCEYYFPLSSAEPSILTGDEALGSQGRVQ